MTFAIHSQKWKHTDGTTATTFHIMESRGYGFVEAYLNEDGLAIGNLSVEDEYRMQGMATEMLDVLENFVPKFQYLLDEHLVVVEVESDSPDWLVQFYEKRGYTVNVRSYDEQITLTQSELDDMLSKEFTDGYEVGKMYEREHPNAPDSIQEVRYKRDFQKLPRKDIRCMVCSNYHCNDCEHHASIDPNAKIEVADTDELHKAIQDLEKIYHCEGCKPTYDEWQSAAVQLGYGEEDLSYDEYQFWNGDLDYTR